MTTETLNDAEIADIRHHLHELQVEHRDLDQVIAHLAENPPPDELLVRRLKKRKLGLKDKILLLEEMLVLDGLEPLQHGGAAMRGELKDKAIRQLLRQLARHPCGLCIITTRIALHELSDRDAPTDLPRE